jgi:hypothetical protein
MRAVISSMGQSIDEFILNLGCGAWWEEVGQGGMALKDIWSLPVSLCLFSAMRLATFLHYTLPTMMLCLISHRTRSNRAK